jgi:hypothetical protein
MGNSGVWLARTEKLKESCRKVEVKTSKLHAKRESKLKNEYPSPHPFK